MRRDLESCKAILKAEGLTCVVKSGETFYRATERGIRPLMEWLSQDILRGAAAADKVIGKAAAFLLVKGGAQAVFAGVISTPAAEVLRTAGIEYVFEHQVPFIQNRKGDGMCPMESAVLSADDPEEAFLRLQETLRKLSEKN